MSVRGGDSSETWRTGAGPALWRLAPTVDLGAADPNLQVQRSDASCGRQSLSLHVARGQVF